MSDEITTRQILITAPGIYPKITSRQYFAEPCPVPALTNSGIKTILAKTPAEFAYEHPAITPGSEVAASTAAKRMGDISHQLALGKGRGFAIGDYPTWASNDAKAFKKDAEANGLVPVKAAEFAIAEKIADIMRERIEQTLAFLGGYQAPHGTNPPPYETEVVMAWQEETRHGAIWCRAMMDVWCPHVGAILDPKFTDRIADGVFENHATNMGWDMQDAWYRRGLSKLFPDLAGRLRFINLLCSPKPPHISRSREADEATRYSCEMEIERAIDKFSGCLKANEWPAYSLAPEPWTARSWTIAQRAANSETEEHGD